MSATQAERVFARASSLMEVRGANTLREKLKGMHFGLVTEHPDSPDSLRFIAAATGLGAQVAQIRPSLARLGAEDDIEHTALWMGRLYDAIECQGLAAGIVKRMRAAAGVPVFDGVACDNALTAAWAIRLDTRGGDADGRHYLVQAALLELLE